MTVRRFIFAMFMLYAVALAWAAPSLWDGNAAYAQGAGDDEDGGTVDGATASGDEASASEDDADGLDGDYEEDADGDADSDTAGEGGSDPASDPEDGGSTSAPDPEGTPSTANLSTADEKGNIISCKDIPEAKGGVLLGRIVPCLIYTIEKSTVRFTTAMISWLRPLFYTFLLLVVTLFGVRMLQHEPSIEKHGFLLLVKIALVLTVLSNIPGYFVPKVYAVMNESQQIIVSAIDTTSLHCDVDKFSDENTPKVWSTMDCVMGKIFGFTTGKSFDGGEKTPNMLLATSLFGLLGGFLFGGAWSVVIFFAMLGVIVSFFMLVVRTAMSFINGYLIACLMLILMPLFLPLIFMRVTQAYFDAIWKNIAAALLMPIIVSAYAMFALMIYDKMMFAPDSIIQKLFDYDQIKDALQNSQERASRPVTNHPTAVRMEAGADPSKVVETLSNPLVNNVAGTMTGAGNNVIAALSKKTNFTMQNVKSPEFKKGKATYEKLFYELINLFILGYMVMAGLKTIENITLLLTGAQATRTGFAPVPGEERVKAAADSAKKSMMDMFRNDNPKPGESSSVSGAKFLQKAGAMPKTGMQAFFKTISRR